MVELLIPRLGSYLSYFKDSSEVIALLGRNL